jgi:hypothetical protein
MEIEQVFNDIYDNKRWGEYDSRGSSGPGSHISQARPFLEFIQDFIDANSKEIKTIYDIGCGDMQYTRHLDLSKVNYTGVDCVKSVIKQNKLIFETENVKFKYKEISRHKFDYADLYIIKDVLQHLNNEIVYNFLDYITEEKLAKYIVICNCCDQKEDDEDVPEIGQTRPLDGNFLPLKKYNPIVLKKYSTKQICLIVV